METSLNIPERIIRKPFVQNTIIVFQNISRRETFDRRQENDITIAQLCECDDNEQLNIRRSTEMQKIAQRNRMKMVLQLLLLLVLIAGFTFAIVYGLFSKGTVNTVPVRGCLTVRFDEHWKSDLDFDSYVEEINNESMTERTWIFQEIQTRNDTKRRGILLSADMGFGKSTIVSNIVCADPMSIWYSLRQQVLIYHMSGAIVRKIPEIGNAILSDDMALDFLYGKCTIDPVACLEFAVLNKLKHFKDERKHLIIIDAIDECETSGGIDLVVPFTSRNIERLVVKFKELQHIDLQLYEQNNLHDIRLYLDKVKEMTNEDKVKLTKISGRNFLHAKLYLQYCKDLSMDECESIPESGKIYVLNFERVFGEKKTCSKNVSAYLKSYVPCKIQLMKITFSKLLVLNRMNLKRKASRILGNELGHFIKVSNGFISFQHKSISDFLTDSTRKHSTFYVDSQNGHKLFAKYLLNALNVTKIDNLVEIVHHAAMSGEPAYENVLIRYVK
ncbi:unnamed protein product [Mytilus edulis]|uniref:Uncharacterized protein n=1 Tax=Mytilus edulis TaxID=6550 RepID=A0A8S3SIQ5_MYTED|nr:unnamed protein product [Mytilus edulis]